MSTVFNTQVGNGKYCLQFETNNKEHYMLMQSLARLCMDRTNIRLIDADSLIEDLDQILFQIDFQAALLSYIRTLTYTM